MAWTMWSRCNKARCNERCPPLNKVLDFARFYLLEFQSSLCGQDRWPNPAKAKWKPPSSSTIKVNFDGAMFVESNNAGIGVIIWNDKGEVMTALLEKIA